MRKCQAQKLLITAGDREQVNHQVRAGLVAQWTPDQACELFGGCTLADVFDDGHQAGRRIWLDAEVVAAVDPLARLQVPNVTCDVSTTGLAKPFRAPT